MKCKACNKAVGITFGDDLCIECYMPEPGESHPIFMVLVVLVIFVIIAGVIASLPHSDVLGSL